MSLLVASVAVAERSFYLAPSQRRRRLQLAADVADVVVVVVPMLLLRLLFLKLAKGNLGKKFGFKTSFFGTFPKFTCKLAYSSLSTASHLV